MAGLYIDTSALARVMLGEPDSQAITAALAGFAQHYSSRLLAIELRRVALRRATSPAADSLLAGVALLPLGDEILRNAERIMPADVTTLDALHLASALVLANAGLLTTMLTYDVRLATAAGNHGLKTLAPLAS